LRWSIRRGTGAMRRCVPRCAFSLLLCRNDILIGQQCKQH
jgi:hypothetical protein